MEEKSYDTQPIYYAIMESLLLEWNKLDIDTIRSFIKSMPKAKVEVRNIKGEYDSESIRTQNRLSNGSRVRQGSKDGVGQGLRDEDLTKPL